MKEECFQENQIWASTKHPEKDIKISYVHNMYGEDNDNSKMVCWEVANDKAWEKFIMSKFDNKPMEEILKRENGTYPYAYAGEKTFKSMKAYIKQYGLILKEV